MTILRAPVPPLRGARPGLREGGITTGAKFAGSHGPSLGGLGAGEGGQARQPPDLLHVRPGYAHRPPSFGPLGPAPPLPYNHAHMSD